MGKSTIYQTCLSVVMLQMLFSSSICFKLYSSCTDACLHVSHISQHHVGKLMLLVLYSLAQPANSAKWRLCSRKLSSAAQPKQQQ